MNAAGMVFTLVMCALLLALPRRYAAIPLLLGAAYATREQELMIGPATFTVIRILVAVGVMRALLRAEWLAHGVGKVDAAVLAWAAWLLLSSAAHTSDQWVYRSGLIWTDVGCFLLFRAFIRNLEDVRRVFAAVCVVLLPVAILMLAEKLNAHNYFEFFGSSGEAFVRHGTQIRARGPFVHPILAGTVGATCFGMAVYLWRWRRGYAIAGLFSSAGIVVAASSSGPILMIGAVIFGLVLFRLRVWMRHILWASIGALVALQLVMNDPVYYLPARFDVAGGSQGWFRARLIESSVEHLDEWWLLGTDYTRHWMPSGIAANESHTDITNHLLFMGVCGGLPLMILFVWILALAFQRVGQAMRVHARASPASRRLIWTLGAILFGQVVNMFSISLFDQSVVFFYLILAAICAVPLTRRSVPHSRLAMQRRSSVYSHA